MKILYLYIQTRLLDIKPHVFLGFIRISNYLNSRRDEIHETIEEEYLDLGLELLPRFIPKNITTYRKKLKRLLKSYYKKFSFDLVAISCYASINYMNSAEVAFLIKKKIAPKSLIVVGGIHPSISPEDFQIGNFPDFIHKKYSKRTTPFDYLIRDEGEVPFFNLVKGLIDGTVKKRKNLKDTCILVEPKTIEDLDDLPIIDFTLFDKYRLKNKEKVYNFSSFALDLSRGCPFRCKFCYNSGKALQHYKKIRTKSIEKCLRELKILKSTKWLNLKELFITDMIFLPKRSKRELFFKTLEQIFQEDGRLPFKLFVMDRIGICSKTDLHNYKKFNIVPLLGLESCSKTLLSRTGKFYGKNDEEIIKGINTHLLKFEEIVKEANKIDAEVAFFYIIGLPGSDGVTFNQNKDYLFKPRSNGKSLIEQYKINLLYNKYTIYKNTELYDHCEEQFGSKIFYKEWWKKFDEYYHYYPALVDPSTNFSLADSISKNLRLFRRIYKFQQKIGNSYYKNEKFEAGNNAAEDVVFLIQRKKTEQICTNKIFLFLKKKFSFFFK